MDLVLAQIWPQPLNPAHSLALSALVAAVPLVVVLVLMGILRRSGLLASACGLVTAFILAIAVWGMPANLAGWSVGFGFVYATWAILWIVFNALWLYHLAVESGSFDLLRSWVKHYASDDNCIQAILVAFCFGALIEGAAGFGAPVAITAFLLVGLGFSARKAVVVALIANTTPVAFGSLGIPIVALAGVTGLPISKLSAMVGRQLPVMSFVLPIYLALVVGGKQGLRRTWLAALAAGFSFAAAQVLVSNIWGPYAADVASSMVSIACVSWLLRWWKPAQSRTGVEDAQSTNPDGTSAEEESPSAGSAFRAWWPWMVLALIMIVWSYLKLFDKGQIPIPVPRLNNGVLITLYQKAYAAIFTFQPLAAGTAVFATNVLTAASFRVKPRVFFQLAWKTLQGLKLAGLTVLFIVGLAFLYNYSGMAYTLGAAAAQVGAGFPVVSSYLGWVACFLSGSDTASNLLFGNLQVAAAHQLHLSPVLMAATNSSGAITGKMVSPQNIAVGVTTVGLVGQEGRVLRSTFWHSVLFAALIGALAFAQAYYMPWMVP